MNAMVRRAACRWEDWRGCWRDWARNRSVAARYLRFCVVGGSGVVVDMGVLHALSGVGGAGWWLIWSKLVAGEVAMLNNFVWNEYWTFRDLGEGRRDLRGLAARLVRFNLICAAGIGLSAVLLGALVRGLDCNVYLANAVAIAGVSAWNFWLNLKLGWGAPTQEGARPEGAVEAAGTGAWGNHG